MCATLVKQTTLRTLGADRRTNKECAAVCCETQVWELVSTSITVTSKKLMDLLKRCRGGSTTPSSPEARPTSEPKPDPADDEAARSASSIRPVMYKEGSLQLECYPYTFSPLLLFAQGTYFDKGHSNYNSVAQFFSSALDVDMLENVLFERKNMLYEELLDYVSSRPGMVVTCCIDSHFTAFQILKNRTLIYYDPLKTSLSYVSSEASYNKFVTFMLMKCGYADSQHIQENQDYYTGRDSNATRKMIYALWREINKLEADGLYDVRSKQVSLNLDRYLLVNNARDSRTMSTQETGNTCYFQSYLFAVLCKVCNPSIARDGSSLDLQHTDRLEKVTVDLSRFLLQFFVQDVEGKVMRPLTNSNFVLDFHRYEEARYYDVVTQYLQRSQVAVPDYELQYKQVLQYFLTTKTLHQYGKFQLSGDMPSTPNTKSLQAVVGTDDGRFKLGLSNYYKYRAANLMFGFNTGVTRTLRSFCEFNALRKNQLLAFYEELRPAVGRKTAVPGSTNKYRDYYFMPQFEIGQQELVDLHHFTYEMDIHTMLGKRNVDRELTRRIHAANQFLVERVLFSTQNLSDYDKIIAIKKFQSSKDYDLFLNSFMTVEFFNKFAGLGFSDMNLKEKDINSLTQTVFYSAEMMQRQAGRMEYEFEKECINQMARSTLRKHLSTFAGKQDLGQKYCASVKIGHGYTYSKYNTLMHFLNVVECYWQNPDINNIQVFGKDIRALLVISCQKVFFEEGHTYYHYGPFEGRTELDLQVASSSGEVPPSVSSEKRGNKNMLVVTDRVYEYGYLRSILTGLFARVGGVRLKTDNDILNLSLLSLLLDFGLYEEHAGSLNLPFLKSLKHRNDKRQLQVEVSNWISDFDKNNSADSVTRLKVEELIFEASYKFMVNKNFSVHSKEFELIRQLNADPAYHRYLLLCKIYVSLCQINKSVEVDYYKIRCNNDFRIIIPQNFSRATGEYLEQITKQYTFSERDGFIMYDELQLFDVRAPQPEIHLHKVRFDSATPVESLVKYVEISNVFRASAQQYVIFIAGNILNVEVAGDGGGVTIRINETSVEIATIFFNEAISFVPCFKYADSEDVILFTSRNIHYLVDKGGQFNENYYGMKHELMECITSEQIFVDLNDQHVFKKYTLDELLTESKTVIYFPDYLLQVQSRQQLINLLDLAIYIRNLSFFVLVLFYLRRASVALDFTDKDKDLKVTKITGPWREAILYVLNRATNTHYDNIFKRQFFDLNQHEHLPLGEFVDELCTNFTRYQRFIDGRYQIVPTEKQKQFLQRIIRAEECFHFSEVGSGKTKVILPLLCQTFLSSNAEAHQHFARGGKAKHVLVILVPEHLVQDAQSQVCRYCLNLNFREEYRIYDDIFALLHESVQLGDASKRAHSGSAKPQPRMKQIFITSFNQFKKALTYDEICTKVHAHRERVLVVLDEVDDFLDRDKLVFNICSNKNNDFKKPTLERYFEASRAVYRGEGCPALAEETNPDYWQQLHEKCTSIHAEIQEQSRSINKSFGIFNEQTLRHCSNNISHDVEGYKSLIARPYESVNRAMPGSYYSDVERTIYLTYYILMEDIAKYDELFQQERKFISFEYFSTHLRHLDYDDLVYGNSRLSVLVAQHPATKDGLARFLYEIILRRMEIQDKSRSVNSLDIVFNFDCVGFTGTPFIDNYPTFAYIRSQREDNIPDMIDRRFYVYASQALSEAEFEERFAQFQGTNSNVLVEYVPSDFMQGTSDELATLAHIFARESSLQEEHGFNVLVDLCGIFKKTSIHEVRDLVLQHFGPDRFKYIYHIDQTNCSDRMLYLNSDNDVQFDEEFYKYLCKSYGAKLREKVFFFIDNRNVIGKDIPFQLIYQRHFAQPLFVKSVVLAHDVDDFSKIWQAMGRSRTMNETYFAIYKSKMTLDRNTLDGTSGGGVCDIKKLPLTRELYVRNCDSKMAGNLSSIYQTIISLFNLSQNSFYYCNEIVNVFLEKMELTISAKVKRHEDNIAREVLGTAVPSGILTHILGDKFKRSARLAAEALTPSVVQTLLRQVVQQKFEQRAPSGDVHDEFVRFLSGEQEGEMEITYTKQQQKQKQKQNNKNQDSDNMEIFNKKHQIEINEEMDNYFQYTLMPQSDLIKLSLNLPLSVPIFKLAYSLDGRRRYINIYPTLQFLYSHHIRPEYITKEVKELLSDGSNNTKSFCSRFFAATQRIHEADQKMQDESDSGEKQLLDVKVLESFIRQSPQYTLAALREGIYIIGMKDQFNIHDLQGHPLHEEIRYIADEMGFVLLDKSDKTGDKAAGLSVDAFGPYFIEQYILMEALSKQEVAQTVMDHYVHHKEKLQRGLQRYSETQGKGFICWRFIQDCPDNSKNNNQNNNKNNNDNDNNNDKDHRLAQENSADETISVTA
ncbi:unnamed protein product [Polarella glacialis]|uniref:Uncharacterized protein n=2 Tax=Polarella glacialis TaxID=89957 RepID=A0A813J6K1_POLGL|nr:unnamed protein product [Polarella glacialis]